MFIVVIGNPFHRALVARGPFETADEAREWARDGAGYHQYFITEVLSQCTTWRVQVRKGDDNFIFECEAENREEAVKLAHEEHFQSTVVEAWEVEQ